VEGFVGEGLATGSWSASGCLVVSGSRNGTFPAAWPE
jgi:hypothetical protein